jgi:hypothetical protein
MIECFVIMPIGFGETEPIWKDIYEPTLKELGFNPIRVDQQDDGTLLPAQIIQYINSSPLLLADLTLSRPNCYFEVGYAMGLNKYTNLILCCRDDHNTHSPKFDPKSGHKLHFDLQSYGVIWWAQDNLEKFKLDLKARIEQRKKKIDLPKEISTANPEPSKAKQLLNLIADQEKEAGKWIKQN